MDSQTNNLQPIVPTPDLAAALLPENQPKMFEGYHTHDGNGSPMIDPVNLLRPFGRHGELYSDATQSVTLTTGGVYYALGNGSGVGKNGLSAGGVLVDQANSIIRPVPGDYMVSFSASLATDKLCILYLRVEQAGVDLARVNIKVDAQAVNKYFSVAASGLCHLNGGNLILKVASDTANVVLANERINFNISSV